MNKSYILKASFYIILTIIVLETNKYYTSYIQAAKSYIKSYIRFVFPSSFSYTHT